MYTTYITVYSVISLPKVLFIHCIYGPGQPYIYACSACVVDGATHFLNDGANTLPSSIPIMFMWLQYTEQQKTHARALP